MTNRDRSAVAPLRDRRVTQRVPDSSSRVRWQERPYWIDALSTRVDGEAIVDASIVKGMHTSDDEALPSRRRRAMRVNRGDRQERILLRGAEKLLHERPQSELTIEAVAAEAGMSRSAVYFYFANKSAIIDTLIEQVTEEMLAPFARYSEEQGFAEHIEQVLGQVFASWRQHRAVFRAAVELSTSDVASRVRWRATMKRFSDAIAAAATQERAQQRLDTAGDLDQCAVALGWMVERSCYMLFSGEHSAAEEEKLLDTLTLIVMRGLGAR